MTTDGGSAGTKGDQYKQPVPTPRPRPDTADPTEPGRRRETQQGGKR